MAEASKSRDRPDVSSRLPFPSEWTASELDRAYATKLGLDADAVLGAFRRYWLRRSAEEPAAATSTNWSRNWQTWCRHEIEYRARDAAPASQDPPRPAPVVPAQGASTRPPSNAPPVHPALSRLEPDLAREVQECLVDPGSSTLWRWALAQQGIEILWRDNDGRRQASFSLGKGHLDVIIINLAFYGGVAKIQPADCNQVVEWMRDYPVVGEFIGTANETIMEARERWKGPAPYSLRAYNAAMQRAFVTWRDSRAGQASLREAVR